MNSLTYVDYVVFVFVLLGSVLIGIYHAWRSRSSEETSKCEQLSKQKRNLSVIPVSLSIVASVISPNAVLGIPSEIFSHSVQYFFGHIGSILGVIICHVVFLPLFYDLKLTSINKYLLKRFDLTALRIVSSLSFNIFYTFVSGIYVYGPALAIASVTPLSINASIITVGLVCAFYTAAGGFKGVIWTDVFQFFVMIAGMAMVAIQGTISVGGWNNVWEISEEGNLLQWNNLVYDRAYAVPTLWECVLGLMIVRASFFATNQMCVQRYCSLPTLFHAKLSLHIGIVLMTVFLALSTYCGITLFANYYKCDPLLKKDIFSPDQLMPYFVVQNLRSVPGLSGLFIATVFSGSLSTLSSAINSMAILTWDDFLKRFIHVSSRMELLIMKIIAFSYGLTITLVAFVAKRMGSILEVVLLLCGGIAGPQFGMFLLGAVCPFVGGKCVLVSFVLGQLVSMSFNVSLMVLGRPSRRLPTSLIGCPDRNASLGYALTNETVTQGPLPLQKEVLWIHNISPFFMPFIGCATTIVSGIVLALATGGLNHMFRDFRYLSPVVHGLVQSPRNTEDDTKLSKVSQRKKKKGNTTCDFYSKDDDTIEESTML